MCGWTGSALLSVITSLHLDGLHFSHMCTKQILRGISILFDVKGVVNCQNSRDKGPPEGNSAPGLANKLTVLLRGFGNCLTPKACIDNQ